MVKSPKQYWKLAQIPSFREDFLKLSPYEQWVVGKTLGGMVEMKDPAKVYRFTQCNDCMDDLYLFGLADDGLGNKGIELQVYLDKTKRVLAPITVRKVSKT